MDVETWNTKKMNLNHLLELHIFWISITKKDKLKEDYNTYVDTYVFQDRLSGVVIPKALFQKL